MKKFYLISAIVVFILVMILALPQIGGACQFYKPLNSNTGCATALFQSAGLGAIMGGLLILFWKAPSEKNDDEEDGTEETSGEV